MTELLRAASAELRSSIYTTMPGKIDTYDPAEQRADVTPMLKRPLRDEDGVDIPSETVPIIPSVTVQFPRADFQGSKFFMSWPLKPGDAVTLHITKWSLDQWAAKELGDPVDPVQFHEFNLSDCYAVPGGYPFKSALKEADADNVVIGKDDGGMQLHLLPNDTAELRVAGLADVAVCLAETLQAFWDNTVKPKVDASDKHTHMHAPGTLPPAPTGPPVPTIGLPAMDPQIISDKLKLKDNG